MKLYENSNDVNVYDFKKALRLSMEQVRVLTRIHDNFAYQLASSISTQLRTIVQVEVLSVNQMIYEEFIKQLPPFTIINIFETPEKGQMIMELKSQMAFAIIDRLLGGRDLPAFPEEKTTLTQIEKKILQKLFEGFVDNLQKSWKDLMNVQLKVVEIETNPQFLQVAIPNETVIVIAFNIKIGDLTELMHICIPYIILEPFLPKLSSYQLFSTRNKTNSPEESNLLKSKLQELEIPIKVELGRSNITIEEFLALNVGDVVQLDQLYEEPLKTMVGKDVKFLVKPGVKKSRMAAEIETVFEKEGHKHES
ncbi:flagellar motor switch protein FliM [Neobacillus bataviensis LMG 21833]|uniref:Flagellar motor switch protein FliM n=1 Tax=Neobacillus bataviensis LMG 21833 TaxID=1117379 RepID=K6D9F8_9BACI|nr:flagellar motor switch protein FliM [Neobacillus bataviensis]EKN64718.1 flagellar motor switch protein FliM [Neobacillus bataviensis LMG 21833]